MTKYLLQLNLLKFHLLLVCLLIQAFGPYASAQCPQRYRDKVFRDVKVTWNIHYGGLKTNLDGTKTWLLMDIYEPKNDTAQLRPVVMLIHGGGFTNFPPLFRDTPDIVEIAKALAQRGYVVVSPEYRLFSPPMTFQKIAETVITSIIDINDAICFLRNSGENGNPYRIDSTWCFAGGSSAGAVIILNGVFVDDTSEISDELKPYMRAVADFDHVNLQELLRYKYCGMNPKGLVSISGDFIDTNFIKPKDVPVLVIHGMRDFAMPFGIGHALSDMSLPAVYGPGVYIDKMRRNGIDVEADIYPDGGHVPVLWPFGEDLPYALTQMLLTGSPVNQPVMDSTQRHIASFFYRRMGSPVTDCALTGIKKNVISGQLNIFPNPSKGELRVEVPQAIRNKELKLTVYNIEGREVLKQAVNPGGTISVNLSGQTKGNYLLCIQYDSGEEISIYTDKITIQ